MKNVQIKDITAYLEGLAPLPYQEHYDNSGLLTGSIDQVVSNALVTVDCTESVVEEALQKGCNLIIAHHPVIFQGIKSLTGKSYVEKVIIKAIKNDIAIYAIHTNLDNVHIGVCKKMAERLDLMNLSVLAPKTDTLAKLVSFVPKDYVENVMEALHKAGAGRIGKYEKCGFRVNGIGTFQPMQDANPYLGSQNCLERVEEIRIEILLQRRLIQKALDALRQAHPYEEVAYYLTPLQNENQEVGSGMIGQLKEPMDSQVFLNYLKDRMKTTCIRHTKLIKKAIHRVALCGGSGSTLLPKAIAQGADVYVSADFKYHDFFEADEKIVIADIGHYESEQFTKDLLKEVLEKKFSTFVVILSDSITNPISYS